MTNRTLLIQKIESLPESYVPEVLNFVGCLKQKDSECSLCVCYNEPNEKTIAAFEEGDAMERGEIPANRFHSFEEMWKVLHT